MRGGKGRSDRGGWGLACAAVLGLLVGGCDSNPTPHPGHGDAQNVGGDTSIQGGDGPDLDNDGVPDCAESGGVWTATGCSRDEPTNFADVTGGDTNATGTAETGDAGDGDDAYDGDDSEVMGDATGAATDDAGVGTDDVGSDVVEAGPSD